MSTPSANITETAIAGKYSRIFVSNSSGTMFPLDANDWRFPLTATDIDQTGFEAFGFGDGLTGIVRAKTMSFNCPVKVTRTGQSVGTALALLTPGRFVVYEFWLIHPDFSTTFGLLKRMTGVAQVIDNPYENNPDNKPMINITLSSRGAIYLADQVAPSPSVMLGQFANTPT